MQINIQKSYNMKPLNYQTRVTEVADTALRLSELFKKSASVQGDAFLAKIFVEIEEQSRALTTAVKKDTAVSRLEETDSERDNAIRVLDKLLKGYEYIPMQDLRVHAQRLITIFRKYGVKIVEENYTTQSNLIMSMLEDFSAESARISIEALVGVKEAIAEIQAKQTDFAQAREAYEAALVVQKEKSSATSLRKPLLYLINKQLIPYLLAMNIAQPEVFKEFVAKVSEIIDSTNDAVKARGR